MRECCEDFNDDGDEDKVGEDKKEINIYITSVMFLEPVVSSLGFDKGRVGQVGN